MRTRAVHAIEIFTLALLILATEEHTAGPAPLLVEIDLTKQTFPW
jgi:hypothetical protein